MDGDVLHHAMQRNGQNFHWSIADEMPMEVFSTAPDHVAMKKKIATLLLSPAMRPELVGERVTAMRETLRLGKSEFADQIGFDRSTLTKVEKGERGLDVAVAARIAEVFGYGMDFIFRGVLTDAPEAQRAELVAQLHAARTANALRARKPGDGSAA